MAVHKLLITELEEDDYFLLAIHCSLEDYRMAYVLNKYLGTCLKRMKLDLKAGATTPLSFSWYQWYDKRYGITWNLINNQSHTDADHILFDKETPLFLELESISMAKGNFIQEYPKADYFLKIDKEAEAPRKILADLNTIPQIITAYTVDTRSLKTTHHLIF